jgi:hypothetical protein
VKRRMQRIAAERPRQSIRQMLEAIVSACLSADGGPLVTSWALLELPAFAAEVHRQEIGSVAATREAQLSICFPGAHFKSAMTAPIIGCVQGCYAHALWLGGLRYTFASAVPLSKEFLATGAAASALIGAIAGLRESAFDEHRFEEKVTLSGLLTEAPSGEQITDLLERALALALRMHVSGWR